MKLIEGNLETLPRNVHVEQDGSHFFIMSKPRDENTWHYEPALAVLVSDTVVNEYCLGEDGSGEAAQAECRAFLTSNDITATFDY